jgi:protein ImuB
MSLPDPIGYLADIEGVLERLAKSICERLQREQKGARRFKLIVRCVDTGDHELSVGFAKPCFKVGPILQQFARPLDALKIEFGADWFRLLAQHTEPVRMSQSEFGEARETEDQLARTMATLGNRIGFDHVRRFNPRDSHLPEYAFAQVEARGTEQAEAWQSARRIRPIRLYHRPEYLRTLEPGRPPKRFEWRGASYHTKTAQGPERLTPEWWRGRPQRVRDYWRVQTASGPRLWLLTFPGKSPPEWFVAGRFA